MSMQRATLFLIMISALLSAVSTGYEMNPNPTCMESCDDNYAYCMDCVTKGTCTTSNGLDYGYTAQMHASKDGFVNLWGCQKYDESRRQEYIASNGVDPGTCDCYAPYLSCMKAAYAKNPATDEIAKANGKPCAETAISCFKGFITSYCHLDRQVCYEGCGGGSAGDGNEGGASNWNGGTGSTDPCQTIQCDPDACVSEEGSFYLYSGGSCTNGECLYNRIECKNGCNAQGDGCREEVNVDVFLMEPYDNQQIDSQGGAATVRVIGVARGASEAKISSVMVSVPGLSLPAGLSMDGDRFSGEVELPGPGRYTVRVEAYGSDGNVVSSAESTVMAGAQLAHISWFNISGTVMRNGAQIQFTNNTPLQEGDEVTITNPYGGWIDYSDGTRAFLNEGVTLHYGKDGDVTLVLGQIEVSGNYAHGFDTRFGTVRMTGTSFKINVDDFRARVTMSEGTTQLFSLYDSTASVHAGQYADIMRDGSIVVYSGNGAVVETANPTGKASAMDPFTHKAAGCCGSLFILAFAALGAFALGIHKE